MDLWHRPPQAGEARADRPARPWPPAAFPCGEDWLPPPPAPRPTPAWIHALLFVLTLLSMAIAGAMQQGVEPLASLASLRNLLAGLPFAAGLLAILAVHEFAHYFAARRWGVQASLPYFLPLPLVSFLGTLGAVIRIRSVIPHRRALLDIGAAGPLAGLAVAVVACCFGLETSRAVDAGDALGGASIELGSPLLFALLTHWFGPQAGPQQAVLLSPLAFAGWVGLFVTAFNLLPIGQLDGGHVVYALFGRAHRYIARLLFVALLGLGAHGILSLLLDWPRGWPGWLALALFLALLGRDHPAPADESVRLDRTRRFVGYLCLLAFVLCFAPVPFSFAEA